MSRIFNRLIASSILCTTVFIFAMEPAEPKTCLQKFLKFREITAVKKPSYVGFFPDRSLMVANDEWAHKVNWPKNVSEKIVETGPLTNCVLVGKKQNDTAVSNIVEVKLYEPNGELVWLVTSPPNGGGYTPMQPSTVFTRGDKLYAMDPLRNKLRCSTGQTYDLPEPLMDHSWFFTIAATADNHNHDSDRDEKIFCTTRAFTPNTQLHTLTIVNDTLSVKSQNLPVRSTGAHFPVAYNQKKNILGFYCLATERNIPDTCDFYDLMKQQHVTQQPLLWDLFAFHPQKSSLVAGFTHDGYFILYDIKKDKMVATTKDSLGKYRQGTGEPLMLHKIAISPDGQHAAVVVEDKCFVIDLDLDDNK